MGATRSGHSCCASVSGHFEGDGAVLAAKTHDAHPMYFHQFAFPNIELYTDRIIHAFLFTP